MADDLGEEAERVIEKMKPSQREIDEDVEQAVARALKRSAQRIWDRRPIVEVIVTRL